MPTPKSTKRVVLAAVALAGILALAACGTRDDGMVGGGLVAGLGDTKAVRDTSFTPPDSSVDFQLEKEAESPGFSGTLLMGAQSGYFSTAYVRFLTSSLPGSGTVVDSARIRFVTRDDRTSTGPIRLSVHRITGDWTEDIVAAASPPPFDPISADTLVYDSTSTGDTVRVDVTDLVNFFVNNTDSSFGFALVPTDSTGGLVEFSSDEGTSPPILAVFWTESGAIASVGMDPTEDVFALRKTPDFVALDQEPGRLTVARGIPARALLRFGLPDIATTPEFWERSTIHRAQLVLFVDSTASALDSVTVGLQRVTSGPWQADSTEVGDLIFGTAIVSAAMDSVVFPITGLVQDVVQDQENFGFLLRAADERPDVDYVRFHAHDSADAAKRPKLNVLWTPGDTP